MVCVVDRGEDKDGLVRLDGEEGGERGGRGHFVCSGKRFAKGDKR